MSETVINMDEIQLYAKYLAEASNMLSKVLEKFDQNKSAPWYNENLKHDLDVILDQLKKSNDLLENPTLKIAFVGTTSSGKSTLLNAIMGHRLMPMDAGEMSAGVVSIRHSDELSMVVESTEGMTWKSGVYDVKSDEDIYNHLRAEDGIMVKYHKEKEKNKIAAPRISITSPLCPKTGEIENFALPKDLGLEFIDLPGLRTVQDNKNLQTIQKYLSNAYLVIVLDYDNTDDSKLAKLLEEVRKTVLSICKNKDGFVFALNKIDHRSMEDNSLDDRVQKLKKEIQRVLEIEEEPVIIPVTAQSYYYVQNAMHYASVKNKYCIELLSKFFVDCAKVWAGLLQKSPEFMQWFAEHNQTNISEWQKEDIEYLLSHIKIESGVISLYQSLTNKLQHNIKSMVIMPALADIENKILNFTERFENITRTFSIDNEKELEQEKRNIEEIMEHLKKIIDVHADKFQKDFQETIEAVKSAELQKLSSSESHEYFKEFKDTPEIIENILEDIDDFIFAVIDKHLKDPEADRFELQDILNDVLPKNMVNDLLHDIETLPRLGYSCEIATSGKTVSCLKEHENADGDIKLYKKCLERIKHLYLNIKLAVISYAKLALQSRINDLEENFQHIINAAFESLQKEILHKVSQSQINNFTMPRVEKNTDEVIISDNIFDFILDVNANERTETEYKNVHYEDGSCFKETKIRQEKIDKQYIEYVIPSSTQMREEWYDGVANAKAKLWDALGDVLSKYALKTYSNYNLSIERTAQMINESLNRQLALHREERDKNYNFVKSLFDFTQETSSAFIQCVFRR